ncbi:PQQ-binding-like beta-propeller repeat protein [candidate division WOR-3 bacterium]|nr:PQQ-binding-like beta-propeller repeat protein [candidate division WOR-3 bacterium]
MKKYYIKPDFLGWAFIFNRPWERIFFTSVIALTLVMYQVVEAEWHQFHGDATNMGSAELGPGVSYFSTPRFVVGDSLIAGSSLCVMNGRIFVYGITKNESGDVVGKIEAFDEETGNSLWTTPIARPLFDSWSSPSADTISNSVYIGSADGLYRIDANTGNITWKSKLPTGAFVDGSPTINVDNSLVYMNTYGSFAASTYLCAFKISNGDVLWSNFLWGQGQGAPAYDADRGRVYFPVNVNHTWTSPGKIAAFDAVTGDEIWVSANTHSCACFGSATYDSKTGTVMAGGWGGSMLIVNADDGSFVVEASVVSGGDYTPAIGNTYVYVTGAGGTQAINPATGVTVWHRTEPGEFTNAVCYAANDGTGRDVVYDGGGGLYMLDADDGTILATYGSTLAGTPALANGNVYFIQRVPGKITDGRLVALGPLLAVEAVELAYFDAQGEIGEIIVNWMTEVEINISKWLIARAEKEEGEYVEIANIPAKGSSATYTYLDKDVISGTQYYYKLGEIEYEWGTVDTIWYGPVTAIARSPRERPKVLELSQNFPNPFFASTTIDYVLPRSTKVKLWIYDIAGRCVRKLVDEKKESGCYKVKWDRMDSQGKPVASGLYIYKLETEHFSKARKMLILKQKL